MPWTLPLDFGWCWVRECHWAYGDRNGGFHASGAAYLFDAVSGELLQTFLNPSPDSTDLFGYSVALTGDTLLIGAGQDDNGGFVSSGAAYLFDALSGELLQTFVNPSPGDFGNFGNLVAVAGDTPLIGARNDINGSFANSGEAYLFDALSGDPYPFWTFFNPSQGNLGEFGSSVAVVGDKLLIGARGDNNTGGAAYLYVDKNLDPKPASISGRILDTVDGTPLSGVTVSANSDFSTTTDALGRYRFDDVPWRAHIVTPSKAGYVFSPTQRILNVPPDATELNFQGGLHFTVSGRITDSGGQGMAGLRLYADTGTSVTTDSTGHYSLQLLEGRRTLSLGRPGWSFVTQAPGVDADAAEGSYVLDLASYRSDMDFTGHDKPPIVFVRGWIGENSDFDAVDDALLNAGYAIYFADIQSTMEYTPSVFKNVVRLIEAIDLARQETGQSKVILVAHSMGGIISRAYLEGSRYRDDVAQLFTFGSPHWGTPISADLLVGLLALVGTPPGALPTVMAEICSSNAAICELSHAGMAGFNLFHRPRRDVAYHFVGGSVPLWKVYIFKLFGFIPIPIWYPAFDEFNPQTWLLAHLIPGPDDGFIPTDSSIGVGLPRRTSRLKTRHETHNSKYQAYGKPNSRDYFSHYGGLSDGYRRCLKPVLVDKTSSTCR